jgi:hypothetical protein
MKAVTFSTDGKGYWSRKVAAVGIVDMRVTYVNDERNFGELRVYFDTKDWDVNTDGLIYTDRQFERELQSFLDAQGLQGKDVSYSEQGMQGDNFVSLDVGEKFLAAWDAKFNTLFA